MYILSVISFLLLGGFLLLAAMRFGVPAMVSDIYYQLQNCTGSEIIGDKRKRNYGWVFTAVMVTCAVLMMICMLDTGKGIQCLAFIGCGGLMFVGLAPNYLDSDAYLIHKVGAIVAALGCIGWCLSACWVPTVVIAFIYLLLITIDDEREGGIYDTGVSGYLAEVAGFLDVFLTYWITNR